MACKYIRKLVVVMMKLLIHVLLKVQANDLSRFHHSSPPTLPPHFLELTKIQINDIGLTSFFPSPLPIWYSQSSELDETQLDTCIDMHIKLCDKSWPDRTFSEAQKLGHESCILIVHYKRWMRHNAKETLTSEHQSCLRNCVKHRSDIKTCFKECCEMHVKKQSDGDYTQNPQFKVS